MMIPPSVKKTISWKDEKTVEELRNRAKDCLTSPREEDDYLYYRFLKARDFDIDKSEKMLRKNMIWRKIHQVDTILQDFMPCEFFRKYTSPAHLGFDKTGAIALYIAAGRLNVADWPKCWTLLNCMRHWYWYTEKCRALCHEESKKTGTGAYQAVLIINLDQLTLAAVTSKDLVEMCLHLLTDYQNNYPEKLKSVYLINVPSYFFILFCIVKKIMSSHTLQKIHVFMNEDWKQELLNVIDADVLPAFLGGNRTDPDGNPLCKTFINHGGDIPQHLILTERERYLDLTRVGTKLVVPASEKVEVPVEIHQLGSVLYWEFLSQDKDIGFGIFFEGKDKVVTEVIPVQKYNTSDGADRYSMKCRNTGKYLVVFDNSYSWWSSKEIYYRLTVKKP